MLTSMCREYKQAWCLNWCCQLLPYFDGKLNMVCWWQILEVLQLQPQKNVQSDCIYVSVGIVWLSHVWARRCISTQNFRDGWVSGLRDTWFQLPCCLVLTQWIFFI